MKNKYGFSFVGLLAVLAIIGLIAYGIFNMLNSDDNEIKDVITNETLPGADRIYIGNYARAIETEVMMLLTTGNDNLSLCVGMGPAINCNIDATVHGRDNPSISSRVVFYSGEDIVCESGSINSNGKVSLYGCVVGESSAVYNVTNGVVN